MAQIECWKTFFTSWNSTYSYSFKQNTLDWHMNVTTDCPPFPADCGNWEEYSENTTTICLRQEDLNVRCFTRNQIADVTSQEVCAFLFDRNLPHFCTETITNSALTIVSITISNAATMFTVSLTASFILWNYSLEDALAQTSADQAEEEKSGTDDAKEMQIVAADKNEVSESMPRPHAVRAARRTATRSGLRVKKGGLVYLLSSSASREAAVAGVRLRRPPTMSQFSRPQE